jgi:drug/metabolite transporter (DMT)-like permease
MGKPKVPPIWLVLAGVILEIIGVVLLSRISTSRAIDSAQYGYQIIAGFGTGMINAGLIILVPYIMEKRDLGKNLHLINHFVLLTLSSCRLGGYFTI